MEDEGSLTSSSWLWLASRHLLSGGGAAPAPADGAAPESHSPLMNTIQRGEVALLFLGFVLITLVWETSIALLGYLTYVYSGRRALWIRRLKDEVLALGVITLVLIVLEVRVGARG